MLSLIFLQLGKPGFLVPESVIQIDYFRGKKATYREIGLGAVGEGELAGDNVWPSRGSRELLSICFLRPVGLFPSSYGTKQY